MVRFGRHEALIVILRDRVLGMACAIVLVGASCGVAAPTQVPSSVPAPAASDNLPRTDPPASTTAPEPSTPPEPGPDAVSGRELIERALEDGRIDHPTSLLYRVYALFDDPRLPADLRGDVIDEDNEIFLELELGDLALPQAIQDALRPFLVRPDHPESVFSGGSNTGSTARLVAMAPGGQGGTAALACIDRGQGGALTTWASDRAQAPVRVWAGCDGQQEADIATVRAVVDEVWAPMTALMGPAIPDLGGPDEGGDNAIDIYLVDWCVVRDGECLPPRAGVLGSARTAPPYIGTPGTSSGFIWLPRTLLRDPAELLRTVVHEIFHVLEYAHHAYAGYHPGMRWLYEGAAKWSETYFIEEAAPAHRLYERFYQPLDLPLDAHEPTMRAYAAYIWFLFAEQEEGGEEGGAVVDRMFEAIRPTTDATQAMQALDRTFSFRDRFRDFAVRNVNDRAILDGLGERTFQSVAGFPTTRPPLQNTVVELPADSGDPLRQAVELHHLSADYWRFTLPRGAEGVAQTEELILDFEGIEDHGELDIDLLVHLPGGWQRQQPDGGEVRFCRDVEAEDLDELWIVLADHDIERAIRGSFTVETRSEPCAAVNVTIDLTGVNAGYTVEDWTITGTLEPHDPTKTYPVDQPIDEFVGTATYTGAGLYGFLNCETGPSMRSGSGSAWLTGYRQEEWVDHEGTVLQGPFLVISAFRTEFVGDEISPPWGELLVWPAPLDGRPREVRIERATGGNCRGPLELTVRISAAVQTAP